MGNCAMVVSELLVSAKTSLSHMRSYVGYFDKIIIFWNTLVKVSSVIESVIVETLDV